MTTIARTQAGVPTGGQFAATSHAEPDLDLGVPPAPPVDPETAELMRAFDEQAAKYREAAENMDVISCKLIAQVIRADHPDAAALQMTPSDAGDSMWPVAAWDKDGQLIAEDLDTVNDLTQSLDPDGGAWTRFADEQRSKTLGFADGDACIYFDKVDEASTLGMLTRSWREHIAANEKPISAAVTAAFPDAVSFDLDSVEHDNGYYFDESVTVTMRDGSTNELDLREDDALVEAVNELSSLHGPLGARSSETVVVAAAAP